MAYYRKLKVAGWVLGGLLAAIVLFIALLHTPPVRRYALKKAVGALSRQGVRFDASKLRYNLAELSMTLEDVTVQSPQATDLPPLLRADRVDLDLGLRGLIRGTYTVENATIRNPRLHLVFDKEGRDNIPRPPQQENQSKTKATYLVDKLLVSGGNLKVEDRPRQITIELPLKQLTVDGDGITEKHEVDLQTSGDGTVWFEGRTMSVHALSGNVLVEETRADIRRLDIGFGGSTAHVAGKIENFADARLGLTGHSTLDLAALGAFAGVKQTVGGDARVSFTADGRVPELKATARIDGNDLTLDRLSHVDVKADAAYDAATSRLRVGSMQVNAPMGALRGTADLALNTQAGQSTANFVTSGLDIGKIASTFEVPVKIASRADARIAARWPGMEFEKASGDATLRLTATQARPGKDVLPVTGTLNAKTQGNRIVIGIPDLRTLNARITGQVVLVNRRTLDGNLKLHSADLAGTVAAAEAYLGRKQGTLAGTPLAGAATVTADLGGTVQAPAVKAQLEAPALKVGDLSDVAVRASADYNPQRVVVESASVTWRGETINAAGTMGLAGRNPGLNLTASSGRIQVASLLAAMNRADIPASGTLSFNTQITGSTKQPVVDVRLAGNDLVAYKETLGTLAATAQVRNQLLEVRELRLDKPQEGGNGTLTATGSYHLTTKDYAVDAETNDFRLTSLTLPDGTAVRGAVEFDAEGKGNVTNPSGNMKLAVSDLEIAGQQAGSINVAAQVADRSANIQAAAPKFKLDAQANIGTEAPYPATFELTANNTDLATLPGVAAQPVKGNVTATIKGSADLSNYERGQAVAEVSALSVDYNGQPVRIDGPLVARYGNQRLAIEKATIVARESRINVEGVLPLEASAGEGTIRLSAKLDLPTLVQYAPDQQITARGTATLDGTIRGTLKRIDPDLAISLENGYFASATMNPPVHGASLRAQIRAGALNIESASANLGPATISASGTVPFAMLPANLPVELPRAQGPAQFSAELRQLDLATLEGVPSGVAGTISARLDASAPRPELEAITGTLSFPELNLRLRNYSLSQQGVSQIALANGTARIDQFVLTGPETEFKLAGTAGMTGARALDVRVDGKLDAAILSAFAEGLRAQGATELHAAVRGTASTPQVDGYLQTTNAQVSMRDPRIGLDNLNLRVDLAGTRATVSRLEGVLNGGDLKGGGTIEYANGQFRNTDLTLKADDVYLDIPAGLKTISDIDLSVRSAGNNLVVGGDILIAEGGYTDDFERNVMAVMARREGIELTESRNETLERIRFNLGVRTENPLVVENNLAEALISADLRLIGTWYERGLSGRMTIEEGSEIRLQEREYAVERGVVTFTSDRRIEPSLDILATTRVEGYDIRLQITGDPDKTDTTLTSDPALPEPDIMALLITGKTMDQMRGQEFEVARNQVLSYLTGRVGSTIGRGIAGATGLSTVRIEPNLIAAEADPGARLTVGQDLTRNLEFVYSMDLVNSSDQIWLAEYDVTKRFTSRAVRQSDGSFRLDFRHDLRFGGMQAPRRGERQDPRRLGNISILGERYFTEDKLRDKLDVKPGQRYDFFRIRKGLDRIEKMYVKADLLESRVRLQRDSQAGLIGLNLTVNQGPVVNFVFEGVSVPDGVQKDVKEVWNSGVFDTQRADEAVEVIRTWLVKDKHLQPVIEYKIAKPSADLKRVVFDIRPGAKFNDVELVFEGAKAFEQDQLREIVSDQKLKEEVYITPGRVTELLASFYKEQGYLEAQVQNPRYELDSQTATGKVVFPVNEGPLFRIGEVAFEGNSVLTDEKLAAAVPLPKGDEYRPVLRQNALDRLRQAYWDLGFNDVETDLVMVRSKERGTVDLTFKIAENRQAIVREIVVEGNDKTSVNMIRTQLELNQGDVLDLQKLSRSRRNLYNTGAYSLIDISREEMGEPAISPDLRSRQAGPLEKPMRLRVNVREIEPYEFRYGGFFDTDRGPGIISDLSNRNSLGSARVLGLRARYDRQLQEGRLYFSQPTLRRFPIKTIASPYIIRERNPGTTDTDPFNVDRIGFSVQQEAQFRNAYLLNYGYRLEKTRTYDPEPGSPFDIPLRIGTLTATLSRETRDEILDATRGSFVSHAFEFSPQLLGSELTFVKYFAQYFKYFALQEPRLELFTNRLIRPRLVYATAVRGGVAKGFQGQEVPLSERFFAGGGTTLRGFEQNAVGPVDFTRQPLGGQAMLVLNNELRFPLVKWFDGVGFMDIGNVYRRVSDFSLGDLRKTAGVGLRLRTGWFLLRLDYGMKLDRKPGESAGRVFFSIGQAF